MATPKKAKQAATKPAQPTTILKVVKQPKPPYRATTARGLYWARVQSFNGQPVTALAKSIASNPPSTPKRGKLAGKCEPLSGWLAFFVRSGVITLTTK